MRWPGRDGSRDECANGKMRVDACCPSAGDEIPSCAFSTRPLDLPHPSVSVPWRRLHFAALEPSPNCCRRSFALRHDKCTRPRKEDSEQGKRYSTTALRRSGADFEYDWADDCRTSSCAAQAAQCHYDAQLHPCRPSQILLYIPNLLGYARVGLLAAALRAGTPAPLACFNLCLVNILLDGVDGALARTLDQAGHAERHNAQYLR